MRCGIALPPGMSVCRRCNPAGLPSPSRTQYHATVFLSVLAAIVVIGVLLAIKG
jgi:predicted nucleic acid-binding Zn ribbon protein